MTEKMSGKTAQNLQPETIPLQGRHLIEASAGTGKTYNITRIYLRLLLERKLDVKNILVMTFTRAATEELRARIAAQLREVLDKFDKGQMDDEFYNYIAQQWSRESITPVINNALLHLDEASIFTIHSFCNRVLSQQAFSSGVAFNVQMEAETRELEMEAVRDWYRLLAQDEEAYTLISRKWAAPESFYAAFNTLFSHDEEIDFQSKEQLLEEIIELKQEALQTLLDNQTLLFEQLVDSHKDKDKRYAQWQELTAWLQQSSDDNLMQPLSKQAAAFSQGNRFGRKPDTIKAQIQSAFQPLKKLRQKTDKLADDISLRQQFELAIQGIKLIRDKVAQSKQQLRLMNYDDLISHLAQALKQDSGSLLAQQIRDQFPVALVDEFQDTDPQQYEILSRVYQAKAKTSDGEDSALYMIGDPKQAIYSFRNGDVFTYLSAQNNCDAKWVMDTNWRSSADMIQAYNRLFFGEPLAAESLSIELSSSAKVFGFNIHYTPVKSSPLAGNNDLQDSLSNSAIEYIYFPYNETYATSNSKKSVLKQEFCPVIAHWCSQEIHRLLTQPVNYQGKPLKENNIAVLVRDKTEAAYIRDALNQAGYSSVYLSTHDNVLFSEEAEELEIILGAILELENERLLVRGLTTRFSDCNSEKLYLLQQQEALWEQYRDNFLQLRELWYKHGFMAMAIKLLQQNFRKAAENHERTLTNIVHLFELLQQAGQRYTQPEQLLNWYREQRQSEQAIAESELRLESDANLIQIITQHGAKGLEYPVVFIPFATRYKDPNKWGKRNLDIYKYHDPENSELKYFMGSTSGIKELHKQEALAESIRLFYVAVTRAKQRCYICAAPFENSHLSPLGKTLMLDNESELEVQLQQLSSRLFQNSSDEAPDNNDAIMRLQTIADTEFSLLKPAQCQAVAELSAAQFSGRIERNWWLSSFSALTRNLRHGGLSVPDRDQEDSLLEGISSSATSGLRFSLPKGADAGNLLHDIFEHLDFNHPDWERVIKRPLSRFTDPLDEQKSELIYWLDECLRAPLGLAIAENFSLSKLKWTDTLREVEFYLPMEQLDLKALSLFLSDSRGYDFRGYSAQMPLIALPGYQTLQGMMHGFIDLVFHWQGKYYIADYKSTWLGNTLNHYAVDALSKNITDNYYDLQYWLYSLALHRYLKNRLPDYQPEQHLGGVYYLYLRGMNPDTMDGIFYTKLDIKLLNKLDSLFTRQKLEVV